MAIKRTYSAQALAIVLVVLMVGVIIALAMMSRTFSNDRRTREENLSADALEISDTVLDGVKGIDIEDVADWAQQSGSPCFFPGYNFYADGCALEGLNSIKLFTEQFDLDSYFDATKSAFLDQCTTGPGTNDSIKLLFTPVDSDEDIVIDKDDVFSLMVRSPNAPGCSVRMEAEAVSAGSVGVIYTPVYAKVSGFDVTEYKEYVKDDIIGQCLRNNCNSWGTSWQPYGSTPEVDSFSINKNGGNPPSTFHLYELRVRAIGGQIIVRRDFVESAPGDCSNVQVEDMMKVEALVTCQNEFRGKQILLTRDQWAPAIFDYVLFNGQGTLEIQ